MAAFEELVRRYETRIYRFTLQFCRNPADAAELTQDTFVKAYQAIAGFNPCLSFGPWLFTIARRKCIDHLRSSARRAPDVAAGHSPAVTGTDPALELAAKDHSRAVWDIARESVSALQFQALWLRYAEDMSVSDAARVLRKPETYVKVLLFRARQVLLRKLRPYQTGSAAPSRQPVGTFAPLAIRPSSLQPPGL